MSAGGRVVHSDALLALALTACLSACRAEPEGSPAAAGGSRVVETAVAWVGDQPVGAADVALRMRLEALDAEAALQALIDEELLLQEAARQGVTEGDEARRAIERGMVRAMLRDFEQELTPESIPAEEVRQDFEENREKLQTQERRQSWHILVKDTGDGGRELAKGLLERALRADDLEAMYTRYAEGATEQDLDIVAERLPPITREAGFEKPYKDALFGQKTTGLVKRVVETSYGYHVIVLTEIMPSEQKVLSEVEDDIRNRLSQKKRFEKLAATVRSLEADGLVQYDDESVQRLLSMTGLPSRAE